MKSPIKWVGGKSRLIQTILPLLKLTDQPYQYAEPFAGGASLFWYLSGTRNPPARSYLSDTNGQLINLYTEMQQSPKALIEKHNKLVGDKVPFRILRDRINDSNYNDPLESAALFLLFNKTCFNGLWRTNKRGLVNVPEGTSKPKMLSLGAFDQHKKVLSKARLHCCGFDKIYRRLRQDSIVLADPPYLNQFSSYGPGQFGPKQHKVLKRHCEKWAERGARVILCAANNEASREIYGEPIATHLLTRGVNPRATASVRESFYVFER